jgi:AraC family transcriptional regulator
LNSRILTLEKGHYLAPAYKTYKAGDLLVGVTEYKHSIETGIWHSHKNPLISYVLYGGNLENRKGAVIERTSGCVNFYHAHESHQNIYKKFPSKHVSIEIESKFLDDFNITERELSLSIQKSKHLTFAFIQILKEVLIADDQSYSSIEILFLELLKAPSNVRIQQTSPPWMTTVKEVLNDRWNENISLQELSKEAGVHPITISKHFGKYFSCTLGEYTRSLKIEKAIALIHASNTTLTEIAFTCGFSDQSHFIRVFKSLTGFLPKDYRKL